MTIQSSSLKTVYFFLALDYSFLSLTLSHRAKFETCLDLLRELFHGCTHWTPICDWVCSGKYISEYKNLLYVIAKHYCKMSLVMCTIECIFMVMEESG